MKKILISLNLLCFLTASAFSQMKFSDETKKYIEYKDSVTILKNALLIDGKGSPAKPHQTVIIINGKIEWVGDDVKAIILKGANIIDLNGKTIMPGAKLVEKNKQIRLAAAKKTIEKLEGNNNQNNYA